MTQTERKLTAAQIILLAGDDLLNAGANEFTEWELSVAAWRRDNSRFGLRGYSAEHPDHKRVMMEIMGNKPHNPIHLRFMEKVRPNTYRLTTLGRTEANRLRDAMASTTPPTTNKGKPAAKVVTKPTSQDGLYTAVADYVFHPVFIQWMDDPEEPSTWEAAAPFFSAKAARNANEPEQVMRELQWGARTALEWCVANDVDFLSPGPKVNGRKIPARELVALGDFLQALKYRFEEHFVEGAAAASASAARKPVRT